MVTLKKVKKSIVDFSNNTRKTGKTKQGRGFLQARTTLLEQYWQKYVALYDELSAEAEATKKEIEEGNVLSIESFSELEITYTETLGELADALENLTATENSGNGQNSSTKVPVPVSVQTQAIVLPRISIPPFDGSFLHWFPFKDLFESIVTNNSTLTNTQRLQYLKDCLTGEAKHALDNVTTTDANFAVAWELLKGKYENRRIIINAHIAEILNAPHLQSESAVTLRSFVDGLTSAVRALKHLGRPVQHWDDWLIYTVVHKLDPATSKAWELSLDKQSELPTFDELNQFLQNRTNSLEIVQTYDNSKSTPADRSKTKPAAIKNYYTTSNQCVHCQGKHFLMFCPEFKNKEAIQRLELIRSYNLCRNCLRPGHFSKQCSSQHRCHVCNEAHHTMLHNSLKLEEESLKQNPGEYRAAMMANNSTVAESANTQLPQVLIGTALVEAIGNNRKMALRVVIDSGAESTFISEHVVQQLKLRKGSVHIHINGAAGERIATAKGVTSVTLKSLQSNFALNCTALVLSKIGNVTPAKAISGNELKQFSHLSLADPNLHIPGSIDMILSAGDYATILMDDVKRSKDNNLIAQKTQLGYVDFGHLTDHKLKSEENIGCLHTRVAIEETLRSFWEIEALPSETERIFTKDELFCENFFEHTTTRGTDGRYCVRLPLKENTDLTQLKSSKQDALALLYHMQKRLNRDEELRILYQDFLTEYHNLGHMELVKPEETEPKPTCYLPHHGIYKESSTTTKLRVVFNAAKRSAAGASLNDCLHTGPKLQKDLWSIILRWRKHRIAYTGDIAKMYRQIWVHKQDTDLLRILWKTDTSDEINVYRLLTVTYGTNCAPYLAIKVLHTLANSEKAHYPVATATLLNDFYVDDVLSGGDTTTEVIKNCTELQTLLKSAGFNLRKFNSNSPEFLQNIDPSDRDVTDIYTLEFKGETKALGVVWWPESDEFGYRLSLDYHIQNFSKRQLLSDVAKLFDPLGLLAPIIIRGKIFLQQLWLSGLQWDDPLPEDLLQKWKAFRTELQQLNTLRIPRWVGVRTEDQRYEIHVFADASSYAYAAVAYLRIITDTTVDTKLLTAKTKVAPLKKLTIPRLELCAAVLAVQLLPKITEALQLNNTTSILWSDSNTVLCWIRTDPGKLKEFVANRVMEIHKYSAASEWRYVPSADNPADQASKGLPIEHFRNQTLWWQGPQWLKLHDSGWPTMPGLNIKNCSETKTKQLLTAIVETGSFERELLEKYSNLDKLLVVGAWCLRFINNSRNHNKDTAKCCSWNERCIMLNRLIKYVQQTNFHAEILLIQNGEPVAKKSKIVKLRPVLDHDDILRLGGRLEYANLNINERCPIILPKDNVLTTLIIAQAHERTLHGGAQVTLHYIRQKYWLIDGRTSVKKYIRKCVRCFRQTCQPTTQLMGNLPPERCNIVMPFLNTGVDYAGPFNIRTTKGRGFRSYKGYVAVFICLSTRAIHLELVSDMTTQSFIAALKRFTACRGICANIFSDRGTTFVGADALLRQELQAFNEQLEAASGYAARTGIQWRFIPPAAPNFGGIWEAGVKSMKHHLKRTINTSTLTFEEFYTVLKQIEACLNSRPLSAASDDPTDLCPLTPAHFLLGRAILTIPESSVLDAKPNSSNRWKLLRQMQQTFWRRWSVEYLQQLQVRPKWPAVQKNIKVGQLVLVRDDNAPPARWLMGRIIDVHPGSDGLVRVVTIKTACSEIKRPISKISALPVEDDEVKPTNP